MMASEWVAVVVGVISIFGSFTLVIRHLVRHYLSELVPNNGSSLKDKVVRLEEGQTRIELRIDQILLQLLDTRHAD